MPNGGDDTSSGSGGSDASAMDVDQSQVFPLPPGAQAQVDFGHTWKQVTGVFNGEPKSLTEVANFVRNFERAIVSGNWTQTNDDHQLFPSFGGRCENLDGNHGSSTSGEE